MRVAQAPAKQFCITSFSSVGFTLHALRESFEWSVL
jgi:hypothetical protein